MDDVCRFLMRNSSAKMKPICLGAHLWERNIALFRIDGSNTVSDIVIFSRIFEMLFHVCAIFQLIIFLLQPSGKGSHCQNEDKHQSDNSDDSISG